MSSQNLNFTLVKNPFGTSANYIARVVNQKTVSFETLLEQMEDNTAIRKQDQRLVVTRFLNTIIRNLNNGLKVDTPIGEFKATLRGSFETLDEDFRPDTAANNHQIKVLMKPAATLVEEVREAIHTEKLMENAVKYPLVIQFENLCCSNGKCRPGDALIMKGVNLKFDSAEEDEGVFFEKGPDKRTRAAVYTYNTHSQLHCLIPQLEAGEYTIYVSSRLGNHQLRTTELEQTIKIS